MKPGTARSVILPILLIAVSLITPRSAKAGGSVSIDDIAPLIPEQVKAHLQAAYEIGEVGDATRLGRHFAELSGARIGPYTFPAVSKHAGRAECEITFIMITSITDARGEEAEDPAKAVNIDEKFDFFEVRFKNQGGNSGGGNNPAPPAGGGKKLTEAQKDAVVDDVRRVYADVNDADLEFDGGQFESREEPHSGDLIRGYARDGKVRQVELGVALGDHGGYKVDVYCDRNEIPSFVLFEESYWSFDPNNSNKTIDTITERRFYFAPDGQLAKALEKTFSGSNEAEIAKNRDAAKNHDFDAKEFGVPNFFSALTKLVHAENSELEKVSDAIWRSQDQMIGH